MLGGGIVDRGPMKGRMARERPIGMDMGEVVGEEEEEEAGVGAPVLTKMMAHVFSKARAVRADVTKRLSASGLRARPAGVQSVRFPG